jgi:DNA-directed RNA polymerase subunit M/transcription elongation factor TFIIS
VVTFICRTCGRTLKAKDEYAGRMVQCGSCGLEQIVPEGRVGQKDDLPTALPADSPESVSKNATPFAEPVASYQAPHITIQMPKDQPSPRRRKGFECPYCHTDEYPLVCKQISTAGWVVFVILLLACFPLCVIGLLITESYKVCSACGIRLG